ncbi:glycosyltransferase family 9 protein [Anatilimnocola sp. NA78]|uniref:glycosyltransferase family 9 protein n=1 Tax=Anatilimnocola sp. NA78 TaxID=3415683 RepID=UPI003CE4A999
MTTHSQPRFLITRLSAIGDCILTMPLACALRDAFPQAWIGWLAEKGGASLLQGHPALDEVIVSPKRVLHSLTDTWQLRAKLRALKIDVSLDPQGLAKSAVMGWLSGAKRRIGFRAPHGRECSDWMNNQLVTSRQSHVVDRYRELLGPLDVQPTTVRFDVPRQPGATQVIASWLDQQKLTQQPVAVINPGAGWDSKLWPAERYAAIAHHLHREHGLPSLVVYAGGREKTWAEQIVAGSHGGARLAPNTSLPELAALLRHARLFVGSDTGPLHLAAAVGVPCVGVYGPTPPTECGPYGPGHRTVQTYLQSGTCRERRKAENIAMQAVTVEQVAAACHDVLIQSPLSRAA